MPGPYFEDYAVGETLLHAETATLGETEDTLFGALIHAPQPASLAGADADERPLASSIHGLAVMLGIALSDLTAAPEAEEVELNAVRFPAPVYRGDSVRVESRIAALQEVEERPGFGRVVMEHRCLNERNEVVAECRRSILVPQRAI